MLAEISTLKYRGKILVLANFFVTLGKFVALTLAWYFLSSDM
jgi:hypothetical protein